MSCIDFESLFIQSAFDAFEQSATWNDDVIPLPSCPSTLSMANVIAIDNTIECVHYDMNWMPFHAIGARMVARPLSDLCAANAIPTGIIWSWAIPKPYTQVDRDGRLDQRLYQMLRGAALYAKAYGIPLLGGDSSVAGSTISTSVSLCGKVNSREGLRGCGEAGHDLWVSSVPGLASTGMTLLKETYVELETREPMMRALEEYTVRALDVRNEAEGTCDIHRYFDEEMLDCVSSFLLPRPNFTLRKSIAAEIKACMDVSDGLVLDLYRLCEASNVSAELHIQDTFGEELQKYGQWLTSDHIYFGGDDYLLVFSAAKESRDSIEVKAPGARRIGTLSCMKNDKAEVRCRENGALLPRRGYTHG